MNEGDRRTVCGLLLQAHNVERDGHLNAARHMREAAARIAELLDQVDREQGRAARAEGDLSRFKRLTPAQREREPR